MSIYRITDSKLTVWLAEPVRCILQPAEMQSCLKGMMTGGRIYQKLLKTNCRTNYRITDSKLTVACRTCKVHLQRTEMQSRLKGMMRVGRNYQKVLKPKCRTIG
jgi:hypothetical protein